MAPVAARTLNTSDRPRRNWLAVVSRSHVERGVAGGFAQANHGKKSPLSRVRAGDGFVFYSPRESHPDGAPLQAFTAIGTVKTGDIYQADMGGGFMPFRVDIEFARCKAAPIRPMIESLDFIRDKQHWGAAFRYGFIEIPQEDFDRIAESMSAKRLIAPALAA